VELEVDGERFDVVERQPGVYDVGWSTGPNPGYGFTMASSTRTAIPVEQLEEAVRAFLRDVDPVTGYIE
jgi:hypothetical protein